MNRLLCHRMCPLCGTPMTKESITDQFRCTCCKWKEKVAAGRNYHPPAPS